MGHCGTAPPGDFRPECYAEMVAGLAREVGADVVVGFSMGATVAYEMVASRAFAGPLVLLGVSLFLRADPLATDRHRLRPLGSMKAPLFVV
jgi:pimeloyl-ACP methyl ester carboxylesterase